MPWDILQKLEILADAAKYDASCASSGGTKRNARNGGMGSTTGAGICHAYTPDGRCVSLLKILLTNFCRYDCAYCVSRRSSNVERARFSVAEVVQLTLDLYRRNCIEGLFLSSGIARSEDDTMEDLVRVAKALRTEHDFRGYIHLKTIPGAREDLVAEAGRYADRLSMNVELPSEDSLAAYAPEKSATSIKRGLAATRALIEGAAVARRRASGTIGRAAPPRFAPAGQSTQVIVGADRTDDIAILNASASLYASSGLKRVYYAAFSPTGHPSAQLPQAATPLMREHRLYQADGSCGSTASACAILPRPRHPGCSGPTSIPSSPGRSNTASISQSTSIAPIARRCCECRVSASARSTASSPRDGLASCGSTTFCGYRAPLRARGRSS